MRNARIARNSPDITMNEWLDDFKTAVAFLTRLPMPHPDGAMPRISCARTGCFRWSAR